MELLLKGQLAHGRCFVVKEILKRLELSRSRQVCPSLSFTLLCSRTRKENEKAAWKHSDLSPERQRPKKKSQTAALCPNLRQIKHQTFPVEGEKEDPTAPESNHGTEGSYV